MVLPISAADLKLLLDQVGDDFCIRFGYEFVALGHELALELEVVFDDAVMHDDDAAGAVAMRMGIFLGGTAVGGPAGMANAIAAAASILAMGKDRVFADDLFEIP